MHRVVVMLSCHEIDEVPIEAASWGRGHSALRPIVTWVLDPEGTVGLPRMHLRLLNLLHHEHHLLLLTGVVALGALSS